MPVDPSTFNDFTRLILAAAIEVHRTLGPGLLESIYVQCFEYELKLRKLRFATRRPVPIIYKDLVIGENYFVDLVVESSWSSK